MAVIIYLIIFQAEQNVKKYDIETDCVKVTKSNILESIHAVGKVQSSSNKIYYANSNAKITYIVNKGAYIKEGDVIVTFDATNLLNEYNKTKIQCDAIIAENNQLINNYYSKKQQDPEYEDETFSYQSLLSNIELAKNSINTAYEAYEKAKNGVVAECAGIVLKTETAVGNQAVDGMPLLTIADTNVLCAKVEITKNDFSKIAIGERCEIEIRNQLYSGKVTSVDKIVSTDESGNSILNAILSIESEETSILIGEEAKAKIFMEEKKNVLTIPISAVSISKKGYFVYVYKNSKMQKKAVTIGANDNENIEITSGLSLGEYVFKEIPSSEIEDIYNN